MPIIIRLTGHFHFTKFFGREAASDRIILPGRDGCRVKVTRFVSQAGFEAQDIVYPTDETVHVVSGRIEVAIESGSTDLTAGAIYHVPAGVKYAVRVLEDSVLVCFFSAAGPDGPLPDDE